MLRIGLTGGIGSGKSMVARLLAERGALLIDADEISRQLVEPGTIALSEIVTEFGAEVLTADGRLDRAALAKIVFGNPARLLALNTIMHPLIAARSAELLAAAPADAVVVYDLPLLVENGLAGGWDAVVVVDAPDDVRIDRVMGSRGMSRNEVLNRMAAQASRADRIAVATFVIDNSGTPEALFSRVSEVWAALLGHGLESGFSQSRR